MSNGDNEELELVSSNPEKFWEVVFARFRAADVPEDFMRDRPLNEPLQGREIFNEEEPNEY